MDSIKNKTSKEIQEMLKDVGYMAHNDIAVTVWAAMLSGKPLLIEGARV